jgi:hypothetical protein
MTPPWIGRLRENPYMFRDAMLKLIVTETLPYAKLIEDLSALPEKSTVCSKSGFLL